MGGGGIPPGFAGFRLQLFPKSFPDVGGRGGPAPVADAPVAFGFRVDDSKGALQVIIRTGFEQVQFADVPGQLRGRLVLLDGPTRPRVGKQADGQPRCGRRP